MNTHAALIFCSFNSVPLDGIKVSCIQRGDSMPKSNVETHEAIVSQKFRGVHYGSEGEICNHRVRQFFNVSYANAPKLLVFATQYNDEAEVAYAPEDLFLGRGDVRHHYEHYASTVCFQCFTGPDGKEYGDFYHPFTWGDLDTDEEHTYVQMRCQDGYYECNNGMIYTVDPRVFRRMMPGSLHYYHLKEFSTFGPEVKKDGILPNPLF